jgi:TPR repeat protein
MKKASSRFQQYIAFGLLISFLLQSCGGGFDNNSFILIKEEKTAFAQTDRQAPISPVNVEPLVDQTLTAEGGHVVIFYQETGTLRADVHMNAPQGFRKTYERLNVAVEQGADLSTLSRLEVKAQQRRICLQLAQGSQPAKVVIYKGVGLAGGMLEGEENKLVDELIPKEFFCPITQEIMEDPVIAQDGYTYERSAIQQWFDLGHRNSPKTGARLLRAKLTSNHTMRSLIQDFKVQMPVLTRHKVDMHHIEAAIKLREEEIEEILEAELEQKTAALRIMQHRLNKLVQNLSKRHAFKKGDMYYNATGVTNNYTKALKWYRKVAEQGHPRAQFNLGILYQNGQGVIKDKVQAVYWYQKAAKQGYASAQCNLAWMYEQGQGVEQNYVKAIEWYQKAADQGDVDAQYNLGLMYKQGGGVIQNYAKAIEWYEKAADQGHVEAQFSLGLIYEEGGGVIQNYAKAVEWYEKAADQGHVEAQFNLGLIYEQGGGVIQNYAKAIKWYEKAADQGDVDAQCNLGLMYEQEGVEQNYVKAIEWYQKAADQGDDNAQFNLGLMYKQGRGVAPNYIKAIEWHQEAADQEDANAQRNLDSSNCVLS